MPVLDHTHTYARWKVGDKDKIIAGERVMRCIDPDCTHYCAQSLALGKRSRCTKCGAEIILDKDRLRRVQPKCLKCSSTKEAIALKEATNMLAELHLFDVATMEDAREKASQIHEREKEQ